MRTVLVALAAASAVGAFAAEGGVAGEAASGTTSGGMQAPELVLDFESELPKGLILQGAQVTDDPAAVIAGRRSLLCDTRGGTGTWHEFLQTVDPITFEPGGVYRVSLAYRVVDPGSRDACLYMLMRSRSFGASDEYDFYGPFWTREEGAVDRVDEVFRIGNVDDYYLIVGVRNQGAFAVDDIVVTRCDPDTPAVGKRISKGMNLLAPLQRQLDAERYRSGLVPALLDCLSVVCPEGAERAQERTREIIRDLRPDFFDWIPSLSAFAQLAAREGIRASRSKMEYQELYKFEYPGDWSKRFETFVDRGMAEDYRGVIVQDETWAEGGYFMCHNGEAWRALFMQQVLEIAGRSTAFCQDNIHAATFVKGLGIFGACCEELFKSYLASRYSPEELAALGIENLATFNIRDYVVRTGRGGLDGLEDALYREFIKFHYISEAGRWAEVVLAVKEKAREQGRPIPVAGNQLGSDGWIPYATVLSQFNDYTEVEVCASTGEEMIRLTNTYKTALAAGHVGQAGLGSAYDRPVWVRGPVIDGTREKTGTASRWFWATHLAEAIACGGVRTYPLGINAPWTAQEGVKDYMDYPEVWKVWAQHARFVDENRGLFARRESAAEVAVVYSLPTMMWRHFCDDFSSKKRPLRITDGDNYAAYSSICATLERMHVPYDVVYFGHPELVEDARSLERLLSGRYTTLVLPRVDCLARHQAKTVAEFAARGGTVLSDGPVGGRNEDFEPVDWPELDGLAYIDYSESFNKFERVMRDKRVFDIKAPETVAAHLWLATEAGCLTLHLVNYDVDPASDTVRSARDVEITTSADFVTVLGPDRQPTRLSPAVVPGTSWTPVPYKIPEFTSWIVVVLSYGSASSTSYDTHRGELTPVGMLALGMRSRVEGANADAMERREEDRKAVKRLAERLDLER